MSSPIKLSSPATREFWEISVCYEDEHLLALDKPPGLPLLPAPHRPEQPSLIQLLHAGIAGGKNWARERNLSFLRATHRLDTSATGVLLLAKSQGARSRILDDFGTDLPARALLVLAQGTPKENQFEVEAKLEPDSSRPGLMRVSPKRGKRSRTRFEVLEQFGAYSLLRCTLLTDRPHQVRAHLCFAGLPVVGDRRYGGRTLFLSHLKDNYRPKHKQPERPLMERPAVHAERISLTHPVTNEPLTITAPPPKDLEVALKYLRKFA